MASPLLSPSPLDAVRVSMGQTILEEKSRPRRNRVPISRVVKGEDREIGGGSFGRVYRGFLLDPVEPGAEEGEKKERGKQLVAVKSIYNKDVFEHEAMVLSLLNHDHVVRYIGECVSGAHHYLITEFLAGGDLRKFLAQHRDSPLPSTLAHSIVQQLASALHYLHDGDIPIIHRDVKSPNILLVSPDPVDVQIKLADVGIARPQAFHGTVMTEGHAGTSAWMAPEVIFSQPHNINTYTTQADVYSFGMVVWEVLARQVPHEGAASHSICYLNALGKLHLSDPGSGPLHLRRLIRQCTTFSPRMRPPMSVVCKRLMELASLAKDFDADHPEHVTHVDRLFPQTEAHQQESPAFVAVAERAFAAPSVSTVLAGLDDRTRAMAQQLIRDALHAIFDGSPDDPSVKLAAGCAVSLASGRQGSSGSGTAKPVGVGGASGSGVGSVGGGAGGAEMETDDKKRHKLDGDGAGAQ